MTVAGILNKKYKNKEGTYPVCIRVIHGIEQRLKATGYKIAEKDWKAGKVSPKHRDSAIINSLIEDEVSRVRKYHADCARTGAPFDIDLCFRDIQANSFTAYLIHRAGQHQQAEQVIMGRKVARLAKELKACFGDLYFYQVNPDLIRRYDIYLQNAGNGASTRSKKMEFLRKYYGNALREKLAAGDNPFTDYRIKVEPVRKHKLSHEQLQALVESESEPFYRDLFLFAYYCRGIRFETAITMKKTAVQNGRLQYKTNKGKKNLSTKLHPKITAIIERYINNPTDTIFGRVNQVESLGPEAYVGRIGSENTLANRALKIIGAEIDLPFALTYHMSRHTFAQHLKVNKADIHVIKESLGHSKIQTTERYLKELDDEQVDPDLDKLYGSI